MARGRRVRWVVLAALLVAAGCSTDSSSDSSTDDSAAAAEEEIPSYQVLVEALADDDLVGRDNGFEGSVIAQELIIEQMSEFADPLPEGASSDDPYLHAFTAGTNILGVIPGAGDLAAEYVVVGAHYDHIGRDCVSSDPADDICNGATDNAAGVAAAMEVGRTVAASDASPRRSVVLAFWDAEEDGLLGASAYLADPPYPLADTVGYVNFDIQGSNLLPALADGTIMVGAETGGPNLVAAAGDAADASTLNTVALSLLFGQGRSDHAVFAAAQVPSVFFTDANGPCYHTAQDDVDVVDFDKLGEQITTAETLTLDLVTTDQPPAFAADTPAATYDDAVSMYEVVADAEPDFSLFDPEGQAAAEQFVIDLETVVDAGPEAFDSESVATLLGGSIEFVEALASGDCDGFLQD